MKTYKVQMSLVSPAILMTDDRREAESVARKYGAMVWSYASKMIVYRSR